MAEQWLPVRGYEGRYDVSSHGHVRSLNYLRMGRVQVLRLGTNAQGYRHVSLYKDGRQRLFRIHVLVLEAFVGPRPLGLVCDHIDSNPANNRVGNLCWVTQSENTLRGRSPEVSGRRCRMQVGSKNPSAKMTEKQVIEIRLRYASGGVTYKELGNLYGMAVSSIHDIMHRRKWKHV